MAQESELRKGQILLRQEAERSKQRNGKMSRRKHEIISTLPRKPSGNLQGKRNAEAPEKYALIGEFRGWPEKDYPCASAARLVFGCFREIPSTRRRQKKRDSNVRDLFGTFGWCA